MKINNTERKSVAHINPYEYIKQIHKMLYIQKPLQV